MSIANKKDSSESLELEETYVSLFPSPADDSMNVFTPEARPVPPSDVTEDYSFAPSEDVNNLQQRNRQDDDPKQFGAGVVAAIVVMPLLGPVFAVVAGVAAAYGTTQSGPAGDACRAAGEIALIAKDKAKELNQKHQLVDKTNNGARAVIAKAQDVNGRHEILEKIKALFVGTVRGVGQAFQFAAEKMKSRGSRNVKESEWETDGFK
jgi:hypothetical protein